MAAQNTFDFAQEWWICGVVLFGFSVVLYAWTLLVQLEKMEKTKQYRTYFLFTTTNSECSWCF